MYSAAKGTKLNTTYASEDSGSDKKRIHFQPFSSKIFLSKDLTVLNSILWAGKPRNGKFLKMSILSKGKEVHQAGNRKQSYSRYSKDTH